MPSRKTQSESFERVMKAFDLLNNSEELDKFLAQISEVQREKLYAHPIHKYVEGLLP